MVLRRHPGVREAAVVVRDDSSGGKRLVAYVVPITEYASTPQASASSEWRIFLSKILPEYMVPSVFVTLNALPLTPSGKIDRKALPAPDRARPESAEGRTAPRTALEAELVRIWEDLLGAESVGVRDDFFDLGGHSLLAMRLIYRIEQAFGRRLPVATLFMATTIEELAEVLGREDVERPHSSLVPIKPEGGRVPFFCVASPNVNALGFIALARHLDAEQPVYGLQSTNFKRMLPGEYTRAELEGLAAEYIRAMREVQPTGPYMMGGMCAGAITSFEMARQLEAQGQEVVLLAIFDTWVIENTYSYLRFHLDYAFQRVRRLLRRAPAKHVILPDVVGWLARRRQDVRDIGRSITGAPLSPRPRNLQRAIYWPGKDFVPPTYSGRITLFRVKKQPFTRIRDFELGWGARALGGVEVHDILGEHGKLLRGPNARGLALKLSACIERAHARAKTPVGG